MINTSKASNKISGIDSVIRFNCFKKLNNKTYINGFSEMEKDFLDSTISAAEIEKAVKFFSEKRRKQMDLTLLPMKLLKQVCLFSVHLLLNCLI